MNKPAQKEIDSMIDEINDLVSDMGLPTPDHIKALETVLSILSHVKLHGLAMGEEEILDIICETMYPNHKLDRSVRQSLSIIAKAIADKQRGNT